MSDEPNARELALDAREVLQRLLAAGIGGSNAQLVSELVAPRDEDYDKVFDEAVADGMRQAYAPFWAAGQMEMQAKPGQTGLLLGVAASDDLQEWNEYATIFPGGYKDIARHLRPGRLWVRWKFVVPGERLGMAYDGLVWCDDHWAWFPKPWRAIRMIIDRGQIAEA